MMRVILDQRMTWPRRLPQPQGKTTIATRWVGKDQEKQIVIGTRRTCAEKNYLQELIVEIGSSSNCSADTALRLQIARNTQLNYIDEVETRGQKGSVDSLKEILKENVLFFVPVHGKPFSGWILIFPLIEVLDFLKVLVRNYSFSRQEMIKIVMRKEKRTRMFSRPFFSIGSLNVVMVSHVSCIR